MSSALRSRIAIPSRLRTLARSPACQALGLYVLARLVSLDVLLAVARQLRGVRMAAGAAFRLWEPALVRWDAVYYVSIARTGYPSRLPTTADGEVVANAWAFFPAFPITIGTIGTLTGASIAAIAAAVNLIAGGVVVAAIVGLVRPIAGDRVAVRAATIWAFLPAAFLLHVPYAEAMHLAFAAGCLLALTRGRHLLAAALLIGTAVSRGTAWPVAAALAVRAVVDLRRVWRARTSGLPAGLVRPAIALAVAAIAPWIWIVVAWRVTGRTDAYAATQRAWGYVAGPTAMVDAWRRAIAHDGVSLLVNPSVLWLGLLMIVAMAWVRLRRVPVELKVYAVVATALLFALAQPGAVAFGSIPRFAFGVLTMPMMLALWLRRGWMMVLAVVACTWLQYIWVLDIWSGRVGVAP
jgi:hypothetical protein